MWFTRPRADWASGHASHRCRKGDQVAGCPTVRSHGSENVNRFAALAIGVALVLGSCSSTRGDEKTTAEVAATSPTTAFSPVALTEESSPGAPVPTQPAAVLQYKDSLGWSWELTVIGERFFDARKVIEHSPPGRAVAQADLGEYSITIRNLDVGRTPPDLYYELSVTFEQEISDFTGTKHFDNCFGTVQVTCAIGYASNDPSKNGPHLDDGYNDTDTFETDEAPETYIDQLVSVLNSPPRYLNFGPWGAPGCYFTYDYGTRQWTTDSEKSLDGCEMLGPSPTPTTSSTTTTLVPPAVTQDPTEALKALATARGAIDRSKVATGSCGTWAMLVLPDAVQFLNWDGATWLDRSSLLGSRDDAPPLTVTTSDYTGDGYYDFLVRYDGTVFGGHTYGGIFGQLNCEWGWYDIVTLGSGVTQVIDGLSYDRSSLEITAEDYGPSGRTAVILIWDRHNSAFFVYEL